eukprot:m.278953 g.278953  ORF g.278953 m.278953 type:complete len:268 (+) comp138756_c0_seq1:127-930(+)
MTAAYARESTSLIMKEHGVETEIRGMLCRYCYRWENFGWPFRRNGIELVPPKKFLGLSYESSNILWLFLWVHDLFGKIGGFVFTAMVSGTLAFHHENKYLDPEQVAMFKKYEILVAVSFGVFLIFGLWAHIIYVWYHNAKHFGRHPLVDVLNIKIETIGSVGLEWSSKTWENNFIECTSTNTQEIAFLTESRRQAIFGYFNQTNKASVFIHIYNNQWENKNIWMVGVFLSVNAIVVPLTAIFWTIFIVSEVECIFFNETQFNCTQHV